jgi:hypothetical protein
MLNIKCNTTKHNALVDYFLANFFLDVPKLSIFYKIMSSVYAKEKEEEL